MPSLKSPYPYFGGKSKVAPLVWSRLGDVRNYIEPFFGSGAVLLNRPHAPLIETINDADCMVPNFWRAITADKEAVVQHCNWPVCEADLHARHRYLVLSPQAAAFREAMRNDPDYYDPRVAGWWVWGICLWIGGGWCSLRATEKVRPALANRRGMLGPGKRPKLSGNGQTDVMRRVKSQLPDLSGDSGATGRGIHGSGMSQGRPQLADQFSRGRGVHGHDMAETMETRRAWLLEWFGRLQDRLRPVRVCCGDWSRVCSSHSVTTRIGLTGVFLDPPYLGEIEEVRSRDSQLYAVDSATIAHDVREWCLEYGHDPQFRIALCGLEGEHNVLESHGWEVVAWKAHGGYGARRESNDNADRERIWFSPHCVTTQERTLFSLETDE